MSTQGFICEPLGARRSTTIGGVTALAARAATAVCACGAPTGDQAAICAPCTRQLQSALQAITGTPGSHGLAVDLDLALSRQGARDGTGTRRSAVSVLPFDERAAMAARRLLGALGFAWACLRTEDSTVSQPRRDLDALARWLLAHIRSFRQLEDAACIADAIIDRVRRAEAIVDLPPEMVYAGPCGYCRIPLYVEPGATWVACKRHEPSWGALVEARRDWMLSQVADVLAHAAEAIRLLELVGVRVTPVQVSRWAARGRLTAHGTDPSRRPLYRLGDVTQLAAG